MPDAPLEPLPHLLLRGSAAAEAYTYPREVRGPGFSVPDRSRAEHGERLRVALAKARETLADLGQRRSAVGIAEDRGVYLELESDPGFELMLKSLDRARDGIELLAVRERGDTMIATVYIVEGQLAKLERLIVAYETETTRFGKPKNKKLVESISEIRLAVLESFWTDEEALLPASGTPIWWEVWLRVGGDRDAIDTEFTRHAATAGIRTEAWRIRFADRTVLLAFGTPEQMSKSIELLDCVAELRRAKERPEFFMGLDAQEQAAWADDLLARIQRPERALPAVCILDTGVNKGHPLLRDSLADGDLLTCNPAWGAADHHRHGTGMAGLALLGDLTAPLSMAGPVAVEHCLESVKILPPPNLPPNDRELYGSLTLEAIGRIETQQPTRDRVFCMAVATPDSRDQGRPSSWSAAVDSASCGVEDEKPRLVVLAAGNVARDDWRYYPDRNDVDHIHDPGQAWNALTVGAMTHKVQFDTAQFPNWTPVALPGGLSPSSTTSVGWPSLWPNKPDIVLEGGNGIREPGTGFVDTDDPLLLLTTHWRQTERLFTTMGDTSAAAAQAARMAATLLARYPDLWPESVRGLLIHSAEWTPEMLRAAAGLSPASRARLLLRRYGHGVPDLDRACWSASNALTLIAQDALTPFEKREAVVATKDMNLHSLPWPTEELLALGGQQVELRVTLSYFVEPNPARRGWKYRHRYQSHGLRFSIKTPTEGLDEFRARVSRDAQSEEMGARTQDDPGWSIGPMQRNQGSVHSDRWTGSAADLASRGHLAVFPVGGWWKERANLERWRRDVRYSLIVTIRTPGVDVDIYTPVANQVAIAIAP
ncbi:MAG: S8 family peptidase [Rhodocyclaceae bacterium]|nr:S8 family peptidase [Rhodocyclaceae bacterium]